jgi:hypothetical protein
MADDDLTKTHPIGSNWLFSWTDEYLVTVTGHGRRGIKVSYRKPGSKDSKHTLKAGIFQPEELVPVPRRGKSEAEAGSTPEH